MNVDQLREYCLSLPKSKETLQWGATLCFKVCGSKIFAMLSLDAIPPTLTLKATPASFAELTELEGITSARYVGRYNWVTLERLDVLPNREIEELIQASYNMVFANLPSKKRKPRKKTKKT
jgi:predicted DNA-binding protein (MmcQ/YjbR family)